MIEFKLKKERCKGCGLCIAFCPQKNLEFSEDLNSKGVKYAKIKDLNKCTGCKMCFLICPDNCIQIYEKQSQGKNK